MSLQSLLSRPLVLVTGKGGVGRTSVSAALAILAKKSGLRTALIEIEGEGAIGEALSVNNVDYEGVEQSLGLTLYSITAPKALEDYIRSQFHFKTIASAIFENKFVRYFLDATPGLNELMIMGKLWQLVEKPEIPYDTIIVDMPATGHAVAMLDVASVVCNAVQIGPLKNAAERIRRLLIDPKKTAVALVTTAEEAPVTETEELFLTLKNDLKINCELLFINSILEDFDLKDIKELPDSVRSQAAMVRDHVEHQLDMQKTYQRQLAKKTSLPKIEIPRFASSDETYVVGLIADHLQKGVAKKCRQKRS